MPMSEYMRELRGKLGRRLLELPAVSVVTRDDEGRVLLVQHENGLVWVTPGGAVEPNEAPADSAVLEMWEETGLEVELVRIVGVCGGPVPTPLSPRSSHTRQIDLRGAGQSPHCSPGPGSAPDVGPRRECVLAAELAADK